MPFEELDLMVIEWARSKHLLESSPSEMLQKAEGDMERLALAVSKRRYSEIVEELGELVISLILLAELEGFDLTECVEQVYEEMKSL